MKLIQASKHQVSEIVKKWNKDHSDKALFKLLGQQQESKYVIAINVLKPITHFTDFYIPLLEESKNVYSNIELWFEDERC